MGIKNTIVLDGGVTLTDSYLKLNNLKVNEVQGCISFQYIAYKNKEARDEDENNTLNISMVCEIPFDDQFYIDNIDPLLDQVKSKCYEWSKTNGYESFSDILEV